jgi:hypothetical protein
MRLFGCRHQWIRLCSETNPIGGPDDRFFCKRCHLVQAEMPKGYAAVNRIPWPPPHAPQPSNSSNPAQPSEWGHR